MQNTPNTPIISVLGAGSWGTALALYLARCGSPICLWSHKPAHAALMNQERCNSRYLPEHPFPNNLSVTDDLAVAVKDQDDILIAVPSSGFRNLLLKLKPLLKPHARITWATKGLDPASGELLHDVITKELGLGHTYAVLSGPSFAREVAKGLPTAVVVASLDTGLREHLQQQFNSDIFRVYVSPDITGIEVGGIVKNVLAIAAGITDGMQLGANARSALITRGLAEMTRLGLALGGQAETFTGLAGMGDLILTATDDQSRNRRFGLSIGKGLSIEAAEHGIGQVIEGKNNAKQLAELAHKLKVDMPITATVNAILEGHVSLQQAIKQLLSRAPTSEHRKS